VRLVRRNRIEQRVQVLDLGRRPPSPSPLLPRPGAVEPPSQPRLGDQDAILRRVLPKRQTLSNHRGFLLRRKPESDFRAGALGLTRRLVVEVPHDVFEEISPKLARL